MFEWSKSQIKMYSFEQQIRTQQAILRTKIYDGGIVANSFNSSRVSSFKGFTQAANQAKFSQRGYFGTLFGHFFRDKGSKYRSSEVQKGQSVKGTKGQRRFAAAILRHKVPKWVAPGA